MQLISRRGAILLMGILLLMCMKGAVSAGEPAPQHVKDLAARELLAMAEDPVLLAAVQHQNAQGLTLEVIKQRDATWMAQAGMDDFMRALHGNAASLRLREWQAREPWLAELFVTDNQGANVAMSDKTSDYWQGDEGKFTKCMTGGPGELYFSEVEFDKSAQAYLVQVSVPIRQNGQAIGVLVVGVDVDKLPN
ncbi:PDC sensor domain-containing protein [Megalodesulfovibrio paquesii]